MKRPFKKRWIILSAFLCILIVLNLLKRPTIIYLPFNIPGAQMAATIPPLGIFIEPGFKKINQQDCIRHPYLHEMAHWKQYEQMGFFNYYFTYLKLYLNHPKGHEAARKYNWMEEEARKVCNKKSSP